MEQVDSGERAARAMESMVGNAASVNVLNRCNQACPMCGVHQGPDRARLAR